MKSSNSYEPIEVKTAKRALQNNLKWLAARIDSLETNCPIAQKMRSFYTSKMESQKVVLAWLDQGQDLGSLKKAG